MPILQEKSIRVWGKLPANRSYTGKTPKFPTAGNKLQGLLCADAGFKTLDFSVFRKGGESSPYGGRPSVGDWR